MDFGGGYIAPREGPIPFTSHHYNLGAIPDSMGFHSGSYTSTSETPHIMHCIEYFSGIPKMNNSATSTSTFPMPWFRLRFKVAKPLTCPKKAWLEAKIAKKKRLAAYYPNRTSDLRITSATPYHLAKQADLHMTKQLQFFDIYSYCFFCGLAKEGTMRLWDDFDIMMCERWVHELKRVGSKWGGFNSRTAHCSLTTSVGLQAKYRINPSAWKAS
jgi:hypothetical protein